MTNIEQIHDWHFHRIAALIRGDVPKRKYAIVGSSFAARRVADWTSYF